ncbi:MAG: sugar phosphate isomerase/epimerase [Chloroflexota bacterium]|nr:sugar phosphate isomerase/epimerase [Chloroflexota bacterium]
MVHIGCGQLTWTNVDSSTVMEEIALAGYDGAPGPLSRDRPVEEVMAWFGTYGLKPAPPYYSARFWDPEEEASILSQPGEIARYVRGLGCSELYVAAAGMEQPVRSGVTRSERAGQVAPEDAMTVEQFAQFGQVLGAFANATAAEGVASCFHPHVGTVIETAAELDTLLAQVESDELCLGLDTGHIAWAGDDPVEVCLQHLPRVKTLHLKDVNNDVRQQGVSARWSYGQFTESGVFAELGEGMVNFPVILTALRDQGFDGWLIVETDVTMKPTPLESATISRQYLTTLGL